MSIDVIIQAECLLAKADPGWRPLAIDFNVDPDFSHYVADEYKRIKIPQKDPHYCYRIEARQWLPVSHFELLRRGTWQWKKYTQLPIY